MPYIDGLNNAGSVSLGDLMVIDQGGTTGVPGTSTTFKITVGSLAAAITGSASTIAPSELVGNPSTVAALPVGIALGSGLTLSVSGTLDTSAAKGAWNAGTVNVVGAGLSVASNTLIADWQGGSVTTIGPGVTLGSGTLSSNYQAGSITTFNTGLTLTSGTLTPNWRAAAVTAINTGATISGGTLTPDWQAGTVATIGAGLTLGSGTLAVKEIVNATTASTYTIAVSDQAKLVDFTNGVGATGVLTTASLTAGFAVNVFADSAFVGTITPSSGKLNNLSSMLMAPYTGAHITFDGTNYHAINGSPFTVAATGNLSYIAGGASFGPSNTVASSIFSLTAGQLNVVNKTGLAIGQSNTIGASAGNSAAIGLGNNVTGARSFIVGGVGSDWGNTGAVVQGGNGNSSTSPWQTMDFVMANVGSSTSAIRLVSQAGTATVNNVGSLPSKSSAQFELAVQVRDTTNGGSTSWIYGVSGVNCGQIVQSGTAASTTTIVAGGTWAQGPVFGTIANVGTPSVAADTSLGGFNIAYTPGVGNTATMSCVARLRMVMA